VTLKKFIALLLLSGAMLFGTTVVNTISAQVDESATAEPERSGQETLKQWFVDGGPGFMVLPLICLIFGLAIAIERIISLNWATTNSSKLLKNISSKLDEGDVAGAQAIAKATRGPVASIFYQGLERIDEGVDVVEKNVVAYGSVQMGRLENGLVWLSLFIALAPMLGFMGTVIGMIKAFESIAEAGDISPTVVAGGIKVALLTTVFGLVVAIILQIFYNYLVSKIDSIVNNMEDASIGLIDLVSRYRRANKA